jgi:hypothetical protein
MLVGVAASCRLSSAVAVDRLAAAGSSDRGSAGVFWLGLLAGLLLLPSIASVAGQVIQGGTEPLLPSLEVVYPWAVALVATSLFAGLGISRQLIPEIGSRPKRLAASIAFAVVATSVIGGIFAGVSLADNAALRDKPAPHSRFGPTDPRRNRLTPPECDRALATPRTAQLDRSIFSANVDARRRHGQT